MLQLKVSMVLCAAEELLRPCSNLVRNGMVPMVRMGIKSVVRGLALSGRLFLIGICLMSASASASSSDADTCEEQDMLAPSATLALRSTLEASGNYVGLFEFHNIDVASLVEISGDRSANVFSVHRPQARIQFKDLNGSWTTLMYGPIEEYSPPTSSLRIPSKTKVTLRAVLFPKKLVRHDGSVFRLLLSLAAPNKCLASLPFRAHRAAGEIKQFVSITPKLSGK